MWMVHAHMKNVIYHVKVAQHWEPQPIINVYIVPTVTNQTLTFREIVSKNVNTIGTWTLQQINSLVPQVEVVLGNYHI